MAKQKYRILNGLFEVEEVEGTIKTYSEFDNEQFGYRKVNGLYQQTHIRSGKLVFSEPTIKQCEEKLFSALRQNGILSWLKSIRDLDKEVEYQKNRLEKLNKLRTEFKQITNIDVPMHPLFGIDIVKLNDKMNVPDGMSLEQCLVKRYGKRASKIVDELIDIGI